MEYIMNDKRNKKSLDMNVKESDVTVILFSDEKEVFKHAGVIFSGPDFIRFKTEENKYICFSGNFKTEKETNLKEKKK